jgi:cytochrome b involved in lipid metabolism
MDINDIVIIGGGISGIYLMMNLKDKYPNLKVKLLESNNRFGGRIHTYNHTINNEKYNMELGAARIGYHHLKMNKLIDKLNLNNNKYDISNDKKYIHVKNNTGSDKTKFKNKILLKLEKFFISSTFNKLSKSFLQKFYLIDLLKKYFDNNFLKNISNMLEYTSDLYKLNSYDSSKYFINDYKSSDKYFVLNNGLQTIIDRMIENIKKNKNYILKLNSLVNDVNLDNESEIYSIQFKNTLENKEYKLKSRYVVCALPKNSLLNLKILSQFKSDLNSINNIDLLRIYEIYEKENGKVWFHDVEKTVTNNELQFVIPINYDNGLIMSSYTDLKNSKYWFDKYINNYDEFKNTLNDKLSKTFNKKIPESKYIKLKYWDAGVAHWKKNVDSESQIKKMLNLLKNFYICGENYSNYQAWCEGALETSDSVLELIERDINKNNNFIKKVNNNHSIKKNRKYNNKIINVNKTKKNKRILFGGVDKKLKKSLKGYKLSEVEKHNKENDAWIIIDKKVYNITDWIPNHPGGKVIINGIGKDATQMFNNIGHPDYVKNKILPNYLIGKLI